MKGDKKLLEDILKWAKEKGYEELPMKQLEEMYFDPAKETEYFLEHKATFEQKQMYINITQGI